MARCRPGPQGPAPRPAGWATGTSGPGMRAELALPAMSHGSVPPPKCDSIGFLGQPHPLGLQLSPWGTITGSSDCYPLPQERNGPSALPRWAVGPRLRGELGLAPRPPESSALCCSAAHRTRNSPPRPSSSSPKMSHPSQRRHPPNPSPHLPVPRPCWAVSAAVTFPAHLTLLWVCGVPPAGPGVDARPSPWDPRALCHKHQHLHL